MIQKEYYKQLHVHKFDNLEAMNQFLKRYNLSKLIQKEIDNLHKPTSIKEIASITTFQNRKHQETGKVI